MAAKPKRKLTVEAVILDPAGSILLVRQGYDRGRWELPGGKVKKRESLLDAVVRETLEETGVAVDPLGLVGIFYIRDENTHDFVFHCRPTAGDPRPNPPEIVDCRYFPTDSLPAKMDRFTLDRIHDALTTPATLLPTELTADHWIRP